MPRKEALQGEGNISGGASAKVTVGRQKIITPYVAVRKTKKIWNALEIFIVTHNVLTQRYYLTFNQTRGNEHGWVVQ